MEYLTVKEAEENGALLLFMVTYHCVAGRIERARRKSNLWLDPANTEKPKDLRYKK